MSLCVPDDAADGKNRISFHYEMAARGTRMRIAPDIFVYHQRELYQQDKPTPTAAAWLPAFSRSAPEVNASAEPPAEAPPAPRASERNARWNWMVGESCWPTFVRRVRSTYSGFYMTSEVPLFLEPRAGSAMTAFHSTARIAHTH